MEQLTCIIEEWVPGTMCAGNCTAGTASRTPAHATVKNTNMNVVTLCLIILPSPRDAGIPIFVTTKIYPCSPVTTESIALESLAKRAMPDWEAGTITA